MALTHGRFGTTYGMGTMLLPWGITLVVVT